MRLFVKLFLVAFVVVIIASGVTPPPISSEWLVADCIVSAAVVTLIVKRFNPRLSPANEQFEFDTVDDEYEELAK